MLRFKHLHYGSLFTQGGKGKHYIHKAKKAQQGGALGFNGVDYPDPDDFDYLKDEDSKKMLKYIKEMHKILQNQPESIISDPKKKKVVDILLKDYAEVEDGGFDIGDVSQLYADWQFTFTNPDTFDQFGVPEKKKASAPKASSDKKVKKNEAPQDIEKKIHSVTLKLSHYRMLMLAADKKYKKAIAKEQTPDVVKEIETIKASYKEAKTKHEYWKKRMHNLDPNHFTNSLNAQIKACHDDLKEVKDKLDEANIEKGQLKYELKQCLDKKDPAKIPPEKKGTISQASSFKVAEVKPVEKPVDIDAELARLEVMKKTLVSPSLNSYTVPELKAIAKKEKIVGVTGLNKKQLVQLIIDGRMSKKKAEPVAKAATKVIVSAKPEVKVAAVIPPSSSDIKKDPIYINNTVLELKAKCKELGLTGYGHKNKEQLAMMVKSKAKLPKVSKQKGSGNNSLTNLSAFCI